MELLRLFAVLLATAFCALSTEASISFIERVNTGEDVKQYREATTPGCICGNPRRQHQRRHQRQWHRNKHDGSVVFYLRSNNNNHDIANNTRINTIDNRRNNDNSSHIRIIHNRNSNNHDNRSNSNYNNHKKHHKNNPSDG
ncbi:uncharacterized protein EMH_0089840 [Eimeria mitis]|uniref:Uncharacterized protein n=1 Tax=Eimeria mitis TaxID=44415 RepID=U6KET3_9EIME|nr:uncharacterized protein EMH_0089840 [Eimeria mitis]CDJ36540.1 hypothetical protein EMH_0089840 [Eimeria mitis]